MFRYKYLHCSYDSAAFVETPMVFLYWLMPASWPVSECQSPGLVRWAAEMSGGRGEEHPKFIIDSVLWMSFICLNFLIILRSMLRFGDGWSMVACWGRASISSMVLVWFRCCLLCWSTILKLNLFIGLTWWCCYWWYTFWAQLWIWAHFAQLLPALVILV